MIRAVVVDDPALCGSLWDRMTGNLLVLVTADENVYARIAAVLNYAVLEIP